MGFKGDGRPFAGYLRSYPLLRPLRRQEKKKIWGQTAHTSIGRGHSKSPARERQGFSVEFLISDTGAERRQQAKGCRIYHIQTILCRPSIPHEALRTVIVHLELVTEGESVLRHLARLSVQHQDIIAS